MTCRHGFKTTPQPVAAPNGWPGAWFVDVAEGCALCATLCICGFTEAEHGAESAAEAVGCKAFHRHEPAPYMPHKNEEPSGTIGGKPFGAVASLKAEDDAERKRIMGTDENSGA